MTYKGNQTPLSATIPSDGYFEFTDVAGFQQHIRGSTLNAIEADAAASAIANTRFTVINNALDFEFNVSNGNKPYHRCTSVISITVPSRVDGGFTLGDEVTCVNRDSGYKAFLAASGVTVNVPVGWALGFNNVGSPITFICVGDNEWDAFGDLEVA